MAIRRAIGISGVTQLVTFLLGFANVIIVSRLLAPEEIGVFSVAVSILGLAHIVREFGVGNYLIQAKTVDRQHLRAAFSVALASSWAIAIILLIASKPMATLYGHSGIAEILLLLAINFLLLPFGTPALALLKRDLQFKKIALVSIISTLCQTAVTVVAAYMGQKYLSMAWGSLAMTVTTMFLANVFRPGGTFVMPTLHGLGDVVRYGSATSVASVTHEVGRMAPDLIMGKTLGFGDVAFFSRGVGLQRMIIDKITSLIRMVYLPTFSAELRKGVDAGVLYARSTNYLLSITGPVLAVLAVLAEPLILYIFGPQWERSVWIAMVVCASSILTAPYSLYASSLAASGQVNHYMRAEILSQGLRVIVFATSYWLALEQVVVLLIFAYFFEAFFAQAALKSAFGLGITALFKETWRALALIPFSIAGPLFCVVGDKMYPGGAQLHPLAVLLASGLSAGVGWLIGVRALHHPMQKEVQLLRHKLRLG